MPSLRWPLVTRARYDREMALLKDAITREHGRATADGRAKVHSFMRDANYGVMSHPRPDVAIRAVFQQAEREFGPDPVSLSDVLYAPATVEEAIDRAQ